jgi:hypothetical protein
MAWVAAENFATVDRLLAQPDPAATLRIKMLGKDEARLLLRYEASEQNRMYFEVWETVQVVLGAVFFFFLLFGTTEGKISLVLALVLVVLVLAQRFVLTPELQAIGKLLDFASPVAMLGERAKFRVVHTSYVVVELGKWAIQLVLAAMLIARGRARSGNAGQQFNVVDKADHRHINR